MIDTLCFASPSSAVARYSSWFDKNVTARLNEGLPEIVAHIAHLGLDGAPTPAALKLLAGRLFVVIHDPDRIVGTQTWRPFNATPGYAIWKARAEYARRRTIRAVIQRANVLVVTSVSALALNPYFSAVDLIAPIDVRVFRPGRRPPVIGVLGHLHPGRQLEKLKPFIESSPGTKWRIVGTCADDGYAKDLAATLGDQVRVMANLRPSELTNEKRSWRALCVPPGRVGNHAASLSVVETLASGTPVMFPSKCDAIAEYVGAGGVPYEVDDPESFDRALGTLDQDLERLQSQARDAGDLLTSTSSVERWTALLRASN